MYPRQPLPADLAFLQAGPQNAIVTHGRLSHESLRATLTPFSLQLGNINQMPPAEYQLVYVEMYFCG